MGLQAVGQVVGDKKRSGFGVAHDEFDLTRVQLGIDGHHGQPGPPGCIQHLEVGHVVAHENGHALTGLQAQAIAQVACQACCALGQ